MTDRDPNSNENPDHGERPSDPIAGLLKRALNDAPTPERSLLPKIQQRIRFTTRGRYYRDRWSTLSNPVSLLLMMALLILILAAAIFLVLQPLIDAPHKTHLPTPAEDPLAAPVDD